MGVVFDGLTADVAHQSPALAGHLVATINFDELSLALPTRPAREVKGQLTNTAQKNGKTV